MLSGTSTAPRMGTPLCSSSMTWLFEHSAAMRSPGPMPRDARAPVRARQRAPSSAYVKFRPPSTTAGSSAYTCMDRSRNDDGVIGSNPSPSMVMVVSGAGRGHGTLLGQRDERLQRLGVGQRAAARHCVGIGALEDAAHRHLEPLARQSLGKIRHDLDHIGHMTRRESRGEVVADALEQYVVELDSVLEDQEEEELPVLAGSRLHVDDECFSNAGD